MAIAPAVPVNVGQPETVQTTAHRADNQLSPVAEQPKVAGYAIVRFPVEARWEGHVRMMDWGVLTGGYRAHGAAIRGRVPVSCSTSAASAKAAAWALSLQSNASQCLSGLKTS